MMQRIVILVAAVGIAIASTVVPLSVSRVEAAGLPDLVVTRSGSTSAGVGKAFSFKVKLANTGQAATPRGQTVRFIGALPHGFKITSLQDDSAAFVCQFDNSVQIAVEPDWALFGCVSNQPLMPGASVTVLVQAVASQQAGNFYIDVRADDQQQIPESDEGNNSLHTPFTVQ